MNPSSMVLGAYQRAYYRECAFCLSPTEVNECGQPDVCTVCGYDHTLHGEFPSSTRYTRVPGRDALLNGR